MAIARPTARVSGYVGSPDMVAFTIGQVVIAALNKDGTLSVDALRRELSRIALGHHTASTRVNPDMASGALRYLDYLVQNSVD